MSKTITIDIVSDTVCPWCFIGKRRFEAAMSRLPEDVTLQIAWRPFQLNPDMPEGGLDRREYLETKFGGPEGAKRVYGAINEAGSTVDIPFNFPGIPKTPNTVKSHKLIDLAGREGCQDAVVEALFNAYFIDGKDIGDIDILSAVAAAAGMDGSAVRAYLASDEDDDRIREEDAMARRMGVTGVPCFILNRKYAVSGAQDPDVFVQAIEMTLEAEAKEAEKAPAAE